MILSNGENVSPEEIEAALLQCPAVKEVLVGVEENLICAVAYSDDRQAVAEFVQRYNTDIPFYRQVQKLRFLERPFEKTEIGKAIRRSVLEVNHHDK